MRQEASGVGKNRNSLEKEMGLGDKAMRCNGRRLSQTKLGAKGEDADDT